MEVDDSLQQAIVEWHGRSALVLAGPGCGKTHILARRISHAASVLGVPFSDMLCVTFTNRAAREMTSRISAYVGSRPQGLFVGNMHRFCLRFLYENGIIPQETTVLDEEDRREVLASLGVVRAMDVKNFLDMYAFEYQRDSGHPEWVCHNPRRIPTAIDLERMEAYSRFKEENGLIDFDDILLQAYTALNNAPPGSLSMSSFKWIQVDEVQDMTPLQLAIVERVTDTGDHCRLFLGDEQQAIFNFIGAGGRALDAIKRMCGGHIMSLSRNYRSPAYLVELCNNLATMWLNIDPALLPKAVRTDRSAQALTAFTASAGNLRIMAAATARRMLAENPDESVTILTRTNAEGDEVAYALRKLGIEHFHISKQDVFNQIPFKTISAHLAAVALPSSRHAWARLLYQTGASKTLGGARNLVRRMRGCAMGPYELLSEGSTEIERFVGSMSGQTIAVIDTETSGLDIFADDVVQIAAIKLRDGRKIDGSELSIFIESDRSLPRELADGIPNPLIPVYESAEKVSADSAFAMLHDYLADVDLLCGHNISFDKAILRENISRRTSLPAIEQLDKDVTAIDTLSVSRLLFPGLRSHRLGDLAAMLCPSLSYDGELHNAATDTAVTAELCLAMLPAARAKLPDIIELKDNPTLLRVAQRFRRYYGPFYSTCRGQLFERGGSLARFTDEAHSFFTTTGAIEKIEHFDYILELIGKHIVNDEAEPHLRDQVAAHLYDLMTYHESDLFANGIVRERLSVMTVHKAKGLEADNVIVFDASSSFGSIDDRARLLYVAFSRARRRLAIGMSKAPDGVLTSVLRHFDVLSKREIGLSINAEMMHFDDDDEDY
ncbi:MAG: UvrD-helicase domain-containing protein [Muribaculaceae bacterium]|nr:UvrD-helicase domain-containing protein [Muribaculaceae bacterium]